MGFLKSKTKTDFIGGGMAVDFVSIVLALFIK